jgi:hypothetical protein
MLTCSFSPPFYVKHFQRFRKRDWLFTKSPIFPRSCESFFCDEFRFFRHNVSGQSQFEKRTAHFRKLLWLIPFMLAKKLLSVAASHWQKSFFWQFVARKRARLVMRREKLGVNTRWLENTRAHITRKIIYGFEKISLEETKFLPIIMTAARETRIDLWKTICPRVRKNFGSKIYPAYVRVKKLCP